MPNSISVNDAGSSLSLVSLEILNEKLGWDSSFTITRWTGSEIFYALHLGSGNKLCPWGGVGGFH